MTLWISCSPLSTTPPSGPSRITPPSAALLLSLSSDGVSGVHGGERAGAAGNKCLIIRLIILPGGFDLEQKWGK